MNNTFTHWDLALSTRGINCIVACCSLEIKMPWGSENSLNQVNNTVAVIMFPFREECLVVFVRERLRESILVTRTIKPDLGSLNFKEWFCCCWSNGYLTDNSFLMLLNMLHIWIIRPNSEKSGRFLSTGGFCINLLDLKKKKKKAALLDF